MRHFFRAILACGALALPGASFADNKVCYWNAEGLPYSKAPPPGAGEPLFSGGPAWALFAMHMEAPQLIFKSACGNVVEADLIRPREVYRSWGCAPDSSMAQMIEGLSSGGVFVSELLSFLEYAFDKYPVEFAKHCALLKDIEPICYRIGEGSPKDKERYPQCVESRPKVEAFGKLFLEIREREEAAFTTHSEQYYEAIRRAGGE